LRKGNFAKFYAAFFVTLVVLIMIGVFFFLKERAAVDDNVVGSWAITSTDYNLAGICSKGLTIYKDKSYVAANWDDSQEQGQMDDGNHLTTTADGKLGSVRKIVGGLVIVHSQRMVPTQRSAI
jgi:hypothetical protein